jgi:hypothetical protein
MSIKIIKDNLVILLIIFYSRLTYIKKHKFINIYIYIYIYIYIKAISSKRFTGTYIFCSSNQTETTTGMVLTTLVSA